MEKRYRALYQHLNLGSKFDAKKDKLYQHQNLGKDGMDVVMDMENAMFKDDIHAHKLIVKFT